MGWIDDQLQPRVARGNTAAAIRTVGGCNGCGGKSRRARLANIAEGFYRYYRHKWLKKEPPDEVKQRLSVCLNCPWRTWLSVAKWGRKMITKKNLPVNHQPRKGDELYCSACKCFIAAKAEVAAEPCPHGFWALLAESETLAVIIPCRNEIHLEATVLDIMAKTFGPFEIRIVFDGWDRQPVKQFSRTDIDELWQRRQRVESLAEIYDNIHCLHYEQPQGLRRATNHAAALTTAAYLIKVDAHSIFSPGYDIFLKHTVKTAAGLGAAVIPRTYPIDEATWAPILTQPLDHCYINRDLRVQWWPEFAGRPVGQMLVSPTMANIGASWLMPRQLFWAIGGQDEAMSKYGETGVELSLKLWLAGFEQYLNRSAWVGHLFRDKMPYHAAGEKTLARNYNRQYWSENKYPLQKYPLNQLVGRFWPVPTWEPGWNESDTILHR
jgi:glycosyltransferase involved in cell wall biosynthesis